MVNKASTLSLSFVSSNIQKHIPCIKTDCCLLCMYIRMNVYMMNNNGKSIEVINKYVRQIVDTIRSVNINLED